ncbi:MAG: N-acetylmuramoyl-L-alanine amidase [Eubacterium sp.]|nr:N-acetylmuramoyl-L-alanine amidase [Eubacterium sp.]
MKIINKKSKIKIVFILMMSLGLLVACGNKKTDSTVEKEVLMTEEKTEETIEDATPGVAEATPEDATPSGAVAENATPQDSEESTTESTEPKTNGKIIVIDPGHSSVVSGNMEPNGPGSSEMKAADSGGTRGVSSGLTEYELNMIIATQLKDELVERGYTVILTREDNVTPISCAERAAIANNNNADVFLRLHADGSDNSSASGPMGICITASNPYISSMYSESRVLSDAILNSYCAETGMTGRGVWETDTMTGNNWSQVPTTLLEMGFMTNPNEDLMMADPAFQVKMVTGIANGIDQYCFTD